MLINILLSIFIILMSADVLFMLTLHFFMDRKGYYKLAAGIWWGVLCGCLVDGWIAEHIKSDFHHIFGFALFYIFTVFLSKLVQSIYQIRFDISKYHLVYGVFWGVAVFLHFVVKAPFWISSLSIALGVSIPILICGVKIIRLKENVSLVDKMFGALLLLEGCHMLDYPFLRPLEVGAIFGFSMGIFINYFASMLIPIVISRKLDKEFNVRLEQEVTTKTSLLEKSFRDLQETQAKLVYSSKLASLGEMAGGIAHEINNPLGAILLRADQIRRLLKRDEVQNEKVYEFLTVIDDTGKRIEKIIHGLKTFARSGDHEPFKETKMITIVADTLALCEEQFRNHSIELKVSGVNEETSLECNPVQVSQILLNLLSNAKHAVKELRSVRWVELNCVVEEDRVILSVTDSGPGIPENIREKILQPFFTTKDIGEGTGLGLSVSKGIAEQHHGRLFLADSGNTRFVLELPIHQKAVKEAA
ncbi:MAG: GHKL domain-containing protein [Deltaproteobacteria bacterium]|nr:GHKL domain-containing protein [Deltaproteobacteria bacterium]